MTLNSPPIKILERIHPLHPPVVDAYVIGANNANGRYALSALMAVVSPALGPACFHSLVPPLW